MPLSNALKIAIPIVLLVLSGALAWWLIARKAEPATILTERKLPVVSITTIEPSRINVSVKSQGVIKPRTEILLIAEISSKVTYVHQALINDGFFRAGETLIRLDSRDYQFAITQAEADVAAARKELWQEQEEGKQAQTEWDTLGSGQATDFVLRKPHLAEKKAKLAAAEASLAQARLNLSRSELTAPFAGRIRNRQVDVGQFVKAGEPLVTLYPSDSVEVRLPISKEQARFLALPFQYPDGRPAQTGPSVILTAELAGKSQSWQGRIVRTESIVDEKSGMLTLVADIPQPFTYRPQQWPLTLGLFVSATIAGIDHDGVFTLPESALKSGYQVYVLDAEDRLRLRSVDVLRHDNDRLIVSGGLSIGERVLVAGLDLPIVGMKVQPQPLTVARP